MRISTSSVYGATATRMRALSDEAERLNTSISTGKRFSKPSEDAAAFRAITGLKRAASDAGVEKSNLTRAASLIGSADTALAGVETALQRVQEIAILSRNGTISPEQRNIYATELTAIVEDLTRLANSGDASGTPLFSGASTDTPYVRDPDGTVRYTGAGQAGAIPIGDGQTIVAGVSGDKAFAFEGTAGPTDMFALVAGIAAALTEGRADDDSLTDIKTALDTASNARASLGARGARVEMEQARLADAATTRESERAAREDTDPFYAIPQLQRTLSVLDATQASFSKLTSLSLFNYLR